MYVCLQATREGQASYAHVREIIEGLSHRGWEVQLFEPSYARSGRAPGAVRRLLEFGWVQMRAVRAMARADVVYVRAHFAAFPASTWGSFRGLPVVQELNGIYDDIALAWPRFRILLPLFVAAQRMQLRTATLVITVTDGLATWIQRDARPRRVAIVPNGANVELFSPDGQKAHGLPARYVGFVGALARWQGIETMLRAVGDTSWPQDVSLVVVGDGACANEVRAAAAANDRIVQLGQIPYRDVPAIIRPAIAMLSVQSAIARTLAGGVHPLKVFESLACGVPVIVSDHPGQADLVRREECGWVVPADDPTALARAVAEAAADSNRRNQLGERGRAAVVREHSWDARAAATHELLLEVIGEESRQ